jgi:hypothetical protein
VVMVPSSAGMVSGRKAGSKGHACGKLAGKLFDTGGAGGFVDEGLAMQAGGIEVRDVWAGGDGFDALEQ